MPTPMRYDDAVRLCAGTGSIQKRLKDKFSVIQGARTGSYVDRERAYLKAQGCKVGTRYDMWREYLTMVPDRFWWGEPRGSVAAGGTWTRVLNRSYTGGGAVGVSSSSTVVRA